MAKKYIILDTETTGLEVLQGHRVIEIGAVLMNDRKKSDEHFHTYLNPSRLIDEEASKVHGIMNEDLLDKPSFDEIAEEFLEFVDGSTLVIHNADFDIGFLNNELKLASSKYPMLQDICEIEDSLAIAKDKFPGQRNSLDALANRFEISNYDRTFHGALLDANILADVYMMLTGGQSKFEFSANSMNTNSQNSDSRNEISKDGLKLKLIKADKQDLKEHEERLLDIEERNAIKTLWREVH
ncbi:DNA polymerase III subunit epsilon [Gammaproteobacteria bacterium]|jgi:DNA polymerase-3 subunit epsilon|nr:DNA polymerase III subunit epsilon [Gammaproteobacteria bacterium]MDC1007851.1 DNA polymerase III subunit epsilon [Gammaproteobacteria bacterium]MDC3217153.1 DNA polymerase III subunit epsilon [Gammaproteobacteria bacterium]